MPMMLESSKQFQYYPEGDCFEWDLVQKDEVWLVDIEWFEAMWMACEAKEMEGNEMKVKFSL